MSRVRSGLMTNLNCLEWTMNDKEILEFYIEILWDLLERRKELGNCGICHYLKKSLKLSKEVIVSRTSDTESYNLVLIYLTDSNFNIQSLRDPGMTPTRTFLAASLIEHIDTLISGMDS